MKRNELTGFSDVYKFTFSQAVKSKSFVVTLVIMFLGVLALFPFLALKSGKTEKKSKIDKVYVINETGFADFTNDIKDGLADRKEFEKVSWETADGDVDALSKTISENHDNNVILEAVVDEEIMTFVMKVYYDPESKVGGEEASNLGSAVSEWFTDYKIEKLGASQASMDMITKNVSIKQTSTKKYLSDKETVVISQAEYNIVYILLMVAYFVVIFSANMVATKIVEEKTNRIVEYLMTAVRPMALILGKIAAMLTVVIGEMLLLLVGGLASKTIAEKFFDYSAKGKLSEMLSADALKAMSVGNILIAIVIIAVGIFIYALIAGLCGATVSKMEELQQGMKVFNMVLVSSFIAGLVALILMMNKGIGGYVYFTYLFPLVSVFVLPGAMMIGKVKLLMVLIAVVLQFVTALFVLWFVSRVYENVIVTNGNPLSVGDMIKIAKDAKAKGGAGNERE